MSTAQHFVLRQRYLGRIRWSRGSCGEPGCADPECCCSFCGQPIGVPEDDPRWETHDEDCVECGLCRDRVPLILFRGEGEAMEQAQFHWVCANIVIWFPAGPATQPRPTGSQEEGG